MAKEQSKSVGSMAREQVRTLAGIHDKPVGMRIFSRSSYKVLMLLPYMLLGRRKELSGPREGRRMTLSSVRWPG